MKFNLLDSSHEVAVMIVVSIVITENAAIVCGEDSRIDISQTVLDHAAAFVPNLLLEQGALSFARKIERLVDTLSRLARVLPCFPATESSQL